MRNHVKQSNVLNDGQWLEYLSSHFHFPTQNGLTRVNRYQTGLCRAQLYLTVRQQTTEYTGRSLFSVD